MSIVRKALLTVTIATVMIGCCQLALADPLLLSLNVPTTAAAGSTVTILATVTNTGTLSTAADTITNASVTVGGPFTNGSTAGFATNFLNHTVANGATLGPLAAVTFTVVNTNSPITGSLNFIYTNATGASFVTNTVSYTINAVPEPATMLLLGTGLVGIAAKLKRRKKQSTV